MMKIILILLASASLRAGAETVTGTVTRVIDGDTICVHLRVSAVTNCVRVRLAGIDAPEKKQAYGQEAADALSNQIFGATVIVEWEKKDRYGRIIGWVIENEQTADERRWTQMINVRMVEQGHAWWYREYSSKGEYASLEAEAQNRRTGLWMEINPTPPWHFRKTNKRGGSQ